MPCKRTALPPARKQKPSNNNRVSTTGNPIPLYDNRFPDNDNLFPPYDNAFPDNGNKNATDFCTFDLIFPVPVI